MGHLNRYPAAYHALTSVRLAKYFQGCFREVSAIVKSVSVSDCPKPGDLMVFAKRILLVFRIVRSAQDCRNTQSVAKNVLIMGANKPDGVE